MGPSGRDGRRSERRAQLLDAALGAVRELGPSVTMEQLARAGGVTKPILYRHFRDRDGLVMALAERFSADLMDAVEASLVAAVDPRQLLEQTIDAYLRLLERDPELYRFLMQQAPRRKGRAEVTALVDSISQQVAVVIGDQLRRAGVDSGPAVAWAYGIVGLVHHAGDWWVDDRTMSRADLVAYLTALLWSGLSGADGQAGGAGEA